MKKLLSILLLFSLLALSGCEVKTNVEGDNTYFYIGQSGSWLATYSIIEDRSSYYDSLTIQHLFDEDNKAQSGKIGPIEYKFSGNNMEKSSSYPLELQGVANLHTGSRMNAEMFDISFDEEIKLTVAWQGKEETMKLKRNK